MTDDARMVEIEVGDIVEVAFDYGSVYGGALVWQGAVLQISGDEIVLYDADIDEYISCRRENVLRWIGREG